MKFTKMQGAGNDYIYVNCFEEKVSDPESTAVKVSDRHFGIGSDGLVLIEPSDKADFKMDIYNADGSRAKMCGNATRCVAKYVGDRGRTNKDEISLETLSGINGILLYLDEIQYLNKKQQQSLLEYIENGKITLIASTTENPYFYVYNALISRSTVFEFKPLTSEEILPAIKRAFQLMADELGLKLRLENGVLEHIARGCGGDVRKSINTVELCILSADNDGEKLTVNLDNVKLLTQRSNMRYDRAGDEHYDILSALQKSIRGSDENAALHYAARLMEAGDIISLCRRLLVIASEDIGLAYPMAAVVTKSCVDSALQLGLPEARIPLAEAVVLLATAPKSNSAESAIDAALADVRNGDFGDYPRHLQNKHFDGEGAKVKGQHYLYPHDFPNHWVKQQYLPDKLVGRTYYQYGENKTEQMAKAYWEKIKK